MNLKDNIQSRFIFTVPEEFKKKYVGFLHDLSVTRLNVCYWICIVLIPGAFVFDMLIFNAQWLLLLKVRLVSLTFCVLLYFLSNKTFLKKHHSSMFYILIVVVASTISYLTFLTGAYASPYYAGLMLMFIGIAMIFPWGIRNSLLASIVILSIHYFINLVPFIIKHQLIDWPKFWNSTYFLSFSFAMVVIASGILEYYRKQIFVSPVQRKFVLIIKYP